MTIETNQINATDSHMNIQDSDKELTEQDSAPMELDEFSANEIINLGQNILCTKSLPTKRKVTDTHTLVHSKKQRTKFSHLKKFEETKDNTSSVISKIPSFTSPCYEVKKYFHTTEKTPDDRVTTSSVDQQSSPYQSYIDDIDNKIINCVDNKSTARLLSIKGTYFQKLGKNNLSVEALEESVTLDPTSPFALSRLGESYRLLGRYTESITTFEKALIYADDSAFLFSRYGAALHDAGKDLEKAKKFISHSYSLNSLDTTTVRYAHKLGILNDLIARKRQTMAPPIVKDPAILYRSGYSAYMRGFKAKALDLFNQAIACDENHIPSLNSRGEIYLSQEDYPNAIADFEKVVTLQPDHTSSLLGLANCLLVNNQQERGVKLLSRVIELSPGIIIARIMRGEEYRKQQKYLDAFEDFNTAITLIENYHKRLKKEHTQVFQKDSRISSSEYTSQLTKEHEKNLAYAYGRRGMVSFRLNPEQIDLVLDDFDSAHTIDPDETFVWSAKGTVAYEKGNFESAKYYFKECLRRTPKHTHSMNNLGEIARLEKDFETAKSYFKKSIETNPKNSFAYERLGDIYRGEKELQKALMCLNKALKQNPSSHFALSCRGDLHKSLSHLQKAYQDLNAALGIKKDASTFSNLGEVYRMSGVKYYSAALQAYNQAISLDRTFSFPYFCRAKLYATYEKYDKALQNLNTYISLEKKAYRVPNHLAILLRANIHLNQQKYREAKNDLAQAETIAKDEPIIQRYWAMYWYRTGNLGNALIRINKAIELDPKQAIFYSERAKIQLFLRNYELAKENVEQALTIQEDEPTALSVKGMLLSLSENYHGAISTLQLAIKKDPKSGFSQSALGEIYRITGDFDKAKQALNLGVRYSSRSPMPYFLRGLLHFEIGEYANAIDDFSQYDNNSQHYFAPLGKSKETLDILVASMRLIIFLQTNQLFYSQQNSEKYMSMLTELNDMTPGIDLAIFQKIPDLQITDEVKGEIKNNIKKLMKLTNKVENFYAISSLSILYLLLGDFDKMKETLNHGFKTLKQMPSSPCTMDRIQATPIQTA